MLRYSIVSFCAKVKLDAAHLLQRKGIIMNPSTAANLARLFSVKR